MTCESLAEQLDAYQLGALGEAARRGLEAHLAACPACRARLAEAQAVDDAVRAALAWAEPSPAFAQRIAARARRRIVARRWALVGAVAAAVLAVCAALLHHWGKEGEVRIARPVKESVPVAPQAVGDRLLAGEVYDDYGLAAHGLKPGRSYAAAEPAALSVDPGSLLLMARGSQFAPMGSRGQGEPGVSVLAGSLVGQVGSRSKELAIELAPELGGAIVRTKGCEFYSSGFPANRLAAGMPFPAGALAAWPGEIRIHVYSGKLDLDLGAQKLTLAPGDSAVISGGVSAGTARALEQRTGELRAALGERTLGRRGLYTRLRDEYAHRLLELRSAGRQEGLPHLAQRVALVERLLHDHAATLARMEADHPELFELDAAAAELRRLDQLRDEADHALDRFLALVSSEG